MSYESDLENYNTSECPHIDDELMKNFSPGMNVYDEEDNNQFSTTEEVNKSLCNTCNSFKDNRS